MAPKFDINTGLPLAPPDQPVQPAASAAFQPSSYTPAGFEGLSTPAFGAVKKVIIGAPADCCQPKSTITIYEKSMEIVQPYWKPLCFPLMCISLFGEERRMIMRHRFTSGECKRDSAAWMPN